MLKLNIWRHKSGWNPSKSTWDKQITQGVHSAEHNPKG